VPYLVTLGEVLFTRAMSAVALTSAWLLFSLVMWVPNSSIIATIWMSEVSTWVDKVSILFLLYGYLFTGFSTVTATYLVAIVVLFGIQMALLVAYIRSRQARPNGGQRQTVVHVSSVSGLVAALLGIGCAACGSLVLTTMFAAFGGAAMLRFLPLHGAEFGLLGVSLLVFACYKLLQGIRSAQVCVVE